MCIVVIALRYGWTNVDVFPIYEGYDVEEAVATALEYHERRGGKYAVLVEAPEERLYISSNYGEDKPREKED